MTAHLRVFVSSVQKELEDERLIVQNLVIALGVIAALSITSLFGLAGIGVAIVFHEGSTIVVVLNALRLLGFRANPVAPA